MEITKFPIFYKIENMNKKQTSRIDQKRLVKLFKDIKRLNSDESRFCFLIGAGASKSSGIKTGWELSEEWYKDLKDDLSEEELKQWESSIGFDEKHIGTYYPHLYKKRYETSPQIGYEEFKKLMENVEPGIGYVILSQIITSERHNFVITTNFDYLVEDSVRMYTSKKPFSAGHETLAEFISSQTERPTIIKVHRDLFLHPFNDETETQKLKDEWKKALIPILKNFNLIVVGYGGNDGSLMDYLCEIDSQNRKSIYWCIRNDREINDKINDLLVEKDFIVHIKGFDELMISLNDALSYKVFENLDNPEKHSFVISAKKRINDLNGKLKDLLDKLSKDKESITNETREIFTGAMKYIFDAFSEKDENEINKIYQKGLNEYPNDSNLLQMYALFLSGIRKEYEKAEEYFQKAIELDTDNADNIGNYALFLSDIRKDYEKAEKYYKKAIELDHNNVNNNGNYALFLKNIRKDYEKAEEYYKKAIELKTDDADFVGNYAVFLAYIRKNFEKADEYFQKAIELDTVNANNLGNYARFLSDIRKEYEKADEYFQKAIDLDSDSANKIGNYALFLSDIRKDFEKADEYFQKAIDLDPDNANNLGNYALFLSDIRKDYEKAEKYYKKAIELDTDNANIFGNYAHHIIISSVMSS